MSRGAFFSTTGGDESNVRRMARFALAALALGFGGGLAVGLLARPAQRTRTVTTSTVEVVNGSRSAALMPAPIPTLLEGATDPHRLTLSSAVPIDANLVSADYAVRPPRQLIVTWDRAHLTRDRTAAIWQRRGVAIWQFDRGTTATWHRVYTRETPVNNVIGIEGYDVALGDASGDGRFEVLIFFDMDGSAGGGIYHLFANVGYQLRQVFVKRLSLDQGTMSFAHHALIVRQGVDYRGPGIHCCHRKVRETWLRWDGHRIVTVHQLVSKNRRGWPPG
jgi:hypothetical protein